MRYTTVLAIAGSDSCGGAGIQADIKTISAWGCYAATAITAITAQNTEEVTAIEPVSADMVAAQIRAVVSDFEVDAVKIGMVNDAKTMAAIAHELKRANLKNIIIDPVMVSTSGHELMRDDAIEAFKTELMPMATLLTPNVYEAEVLSGIDIDDDDEQCNRAGQALAKAAKGYVLIKSCLRDNFYIQDRLYHPRKTMLRYTSYIVATENDHGTGCTLSSAIACDLACGGELENSISHAREYVEEALSAAEDIEMGKGRGPVNHFFDPMRMDEIDIF